MAVDNLGNIFIADTVNNQLRGVIVSQRTYQLNLTSTGTGSGPMEAIAVLSDITRLKTQQTELEVLARDSELMFSLSEVGIAFLRHGRLQRANDALAQLSGYGANELVGLGIERLFPELPDQAQSAAREDSDLRHFGRWVGERQMQCRDGRSLWVQVSKRDSIARSAPAQFFDRGLRFARGVHRTEGARVEAAGVATAHRSGTVQIRVSR